MWHKGHRWHFSSHKLWLVQNHLHFRLCWLLKTVFFCLLGPDNTVEEKCAVFFCLYAWRTNSSWKRDVLNHVTKFDFGNPVIIVSVLASQKWVESVLSERLKWTSESWSTNFDVGVASWLPQPLSKVRQLATSPHYASSRFLPHGWHIKLIRGLEQYVQPWGNIQNPHDSSHRLPLPCLRE